jgi:hypothetical protein
MLPTRNRLRRGCCHLQLGLAELGFGLVELLAEVREAPFESGDLLFVSAQFESLAEKLDYGTGECQAAFDGVCQQGLLERVRHPGIDDGAHNSKC